MRPNQAMREHRLKLARRIVEYAKNGKTDLAPGAEHTDVSFFLGSGDVRAGASQAVPETPLVACLSRDLPEPGSFRVFDDTGVPIVVVRGKDSNVRAYLNICRHRGARLVRQDCGKANRFTCRFHGWTYDTMGIAVGVPEEQQFCGQIDAEKRLVLIPGGRTHWARLCSGDTQFDYGSRRPSW